MYTLRELLLFLWRCHPLFQVLAQSATFFFRLFNLETHGLRETASKRTCIQTLQEGWWQYTACALPSNHRAHLTNRVIGNFEPLRRPSATCVRALTKYRPRASPARNNHNYYRRRLLIYSSSLCWLSGRSKNIWHQKRETERLRFHATNIKYEVISWHAKKKETRRTPDLKFWEKKC